MGYYFDWLRSEFERNERIAEGIAIGRQEANIETACRMRSMGFDDQQIHKATGLPLEVISNLYYEE